MLFKPTNIEEKLFAAKESHCGSGNILEEVYELLKKGMENDARIERNIEDKKGSINNKFDFDLLETDNIYHLDQIKEICIDYRLRFLSSKYFKGDIPKEAISKIKQLEKAHDLEITGFKIIAPSKLFKLKNQDDPLMFAPIGNSYFYFIHKWGNDLHPLRKILMWPFRNIINLTFLVVLISYLITVLVPQGLFSKTNSIAEFMIIFFFMFKSIAAVVIFYGFAKGKNFNPAIWNSKYYN